MSNSRGSRTHAASGQAQKGPADCPSTGFVITLCALAAPLAVPQPRSSELQRFRFFIRRHLCATGETFHLGMGFFSSLEEAGRWLVVLRGTYPDAFVSQIKSAPRLASSVVPIAAEEDVVKVLQVRARVRDEEPAEANDPARNAAPGATANGRLPVTARKGPRTLEESLDDLVASTGSFESDDTGRTTGVRHLSIEFERKSKPSPGPSRSRRR